MGATTSEGTGPGIGNSGRSDQIKVHTHSLTGPHIVAAGVARLVSVTSLTITIPTPADHHSVMGRNPGDPETWGADDYVIQLTNDSATNVYCSSEMETVNVGDTPCLSFEVTAGMNDYVWWSICVPGY